MLALRSARPLRFLLLALLAASLARADVVISFLHAAPVRVDEGQPLVISGEMFGGSELESAQVIYRSGESGWRGVPLVPASGFAWRAEIPGEGVTAPLLEYWVQGIDGLGERHAIFASEGDPARVQVDSSLERLVERDRGRGRAPPAAPVPSEPVHEVVVPSMPNQTTSAPAPSPANGSGEIVGTHTIQARPVAPLAPTPGPSESLPPAPEAVKSIVAAAPAAGPTGVPNPQRKNRRARPSDLSLFAPEDPASLADGKDAPSQETPGLSTVLGEDLLKALGVRTVAEALAFVPGLFITTDALGFKAASARGLRDDAGILVLYDGQALNGAVDGRAFLELPTENLERIEVLRGPASSRYGSGAVLAVVNLVPRRKDGVAAAIAGDSSPGAALDFHGGGQLSRIQIDGDLDVRVDDPSGKSVAQDALTNTLRTQGLLGLATPAGALDDSGLLLNAGARLVAANALGGELELKLRAIHEKRGVHLGEGFVVGGEPALGGGDASGISRDLLLVDLAWRRALGPVQLELHGHGGERDETRAFELAPPGAILSGETYARGVHAQESWAQHSLGAEVGARFEIPSLFLRGEARAGIARDWLGLYQLSADVSTTGTPQNAVLVSSLQLGQDTPGLSGRTDLFLLGQLEWRPLTNLLVLGGARFDALPGADAASCSGAPCLDPALAARADLATVSPNLAAVFQPGAGTAVKLLAGRSFRAPTFDELASRPFLPSALYIGQLRGAEGLGLEASDSAALSFEWAGPLADGRGHLRAAGAVTDLSQMIVQVPAGDHLDTVNALQPMRSFSLELEGRLESSRRNWQMVSLSWSRARDLGVSESVWRLRDLPQVRCVLAAAAPIGNWLNVVLWLEGDGARQNNQRTPLESARAYSIPASALVSLTLRSEPIWNRLELALTLRDLLGAATPDDLARPDLVPGLLPNPGFTATLTARARF